MTTDGWWVIKETQQKHNKWLTAQGQSRLISYRDQEISWPIFTKEKLLSKAYLKGFDHSIPMAPIMQTYLICILGNF